VWGVSVHKITPFHRVAEGGGVTAEVQALTERKDELLKILRLREEVAALEKSIEDASGDYGLIVEMAILEVCRAYSIGMSRMKMRDRLEYVSVPRHVARWIIRELTPLSSQAVANLFGRKDHATIIYSCQYVRKRMDVDPVFRAQTVLIKDRVRKYINEKQGTQTAASPDRPNTGPSGLERVQPVLGRSTPGGGPFQGFRGGLRESSRL
jgi:hypothetical protein